MLKKILICIMASMLTLLPYSIAFASSPVPDPDNDFALEQLDYLINERPDVNIWEISCINPDGGIDYWVIGLVDTLTLDIVDNKPTVLYSGDPFVHDDVFDLMFPIFETPYSELYNSFYLYFTFEDYPNIVTNFKYCPIGYEEYEEDGYNTTYNIKIYNYNNISISDVLQDTKDVAGGILGVSRSIIAFIVAYPLLLLFALLGIISFAFITVKNLKYRG